MNKLLLTLMISITTLNALADDDWDCSIGCEYKNIYYEERNPQTGLYEEKGVRVERHGDGSTEYNQIDKYGNNVPNSVDIRTVPRLRALNE